MNVGFISLGCSKNLVDTEMMVGLFKNNNYKIVNDPKEADIIIINTCGFIESAKEEAINTILEMAQYKIKKQDAKKLYENEESYSVEKKSNNQVGKCKYLIVTGCLVERYKEELKESLPEVDGFVKFSEYDTFWKQIDDIINKNKIVREYKHSTLDIKNNLNNIGKNTDNNKLDFLDRVVTTGTNYAYLRIAEGCNNFCTFCAIPYIRGRYVSRKKEDIIEETKKLAKEGIKEIIVIAQDTTKYGEDIYGKSCLAELLHEISKVNGIEWIRFLYSYPETITEELIKEVKENKKICKYFDIPIQHVSDKILKKMNRKNTNASTKKLIEKLRKEIPNVIIRSTLMVGFPGEDENDFNQMYDFVKWAKFDKLGCFTYSKEDGTPASKMPNQIHPMTKKSRYNKIMKLQQEISKSNLKKNIGNILDVLIEDEYTVKENSDNSLNQNQVKGNLKSNNSIKNLKEAHYLIGRTYMDVPDIDGKVYIKIDEEQNKKLNTTKNNIEKSCLGSKEKSYLNQFVKCKIVAVKEYDLIAELV